ncbi:hypothetical protein EV138_4894 [Kribbella voronezhensis]|uniref:Cobalt/nickel transport protein n=1 Tax=Kribbella voronezhensis TaxID=2512212 RepID=A0A4R7TGD7_9ACTN|nr:hypothetical protein [Kribbella voronezhensis]TDU91290.1 hypothetical protein EV138_4894 [Kribbella voronezhensis]
MKHIYTLVAIPAVACGIVLAGSAQASARVIYPDDAYRESVVTVPVPGPATVTEVDDALAEGLQAGASAIGGAGIALSALWVYRRRHPLGAH